MRRLSKQNSNGSFSGYGSGVKPRLRPSTAPSLNNNNGNKAQRPLARRESRRSSSDNLRRASIGSVEVEGKVTVKYM